jgi:ABC-type glycerol-3-phosphate transport system permease component
MGVEAPTTMTLLSMIPLLLVYFTAQRKFFQGITSRA